MLSEQTANARVEPNDLRGGINITIDFEGTCVSPVWRLGGFHIQFVGLAAGRAINVDLHNGPVYLKVVVGEVNSGPRKAFPASGQVMSTKLKEPRVIAQRDALLCVITDTAEAVDEITDMAQLTFSGPLAERITWQSFEEKFGSFTDVFDGLHAHMLPGLHVLDAAGAEITNLLLWTTGKGADASTHNHGQTPTPGSPAFAEIHLVLRNGTGAGGMYLCDAPDSAERETMPVQVGEEHGPFFYVDDSSGAPRLRENGAVDYPWHGWQGGSDGIEGEAYDLVAAFEISPAYARI
jgi:hypothetical protein